MPDAKRLFTPGPLNTSETVKRAMLEDVGSRDALFLELVAEVRAQLLQIAGASQADGYEAIPMQGSGTFGIESILSTAISTEDHLLILANGAYGERIAEIAACLGIQHDVHRCAENAIHEPELVARILRESEFTHLAVVHCETTTGILNPIRDWGQVAKTHHCRYIVDAMSSFGGIPIHLAESNIDYLVSSSNKCLQGVPGFSFVIARREALEAIRHEPRSVSLDLLAQWKRLESDGQFRFTPPTHVLLAFRQALRELEQEGGVRARNERYHENHRALVDGMRQLGFTEYVPPSSQSPIITAFLYPDDPRFAFHKFYQYLSAEGLLIYPGKLSAVDCFRIGTIGDLDESDVKKLLRTIESTLHKMQLR